MRYLLIIVTCLLSVANTANAADSIKHTGTFSSLRSNEEAGNLLGTELRIVYTKNGYQGTLQIAEGEPSKIIVITPVLNGENISFKIDDPLYKGRFEGRYTDLGVVGNIYYEGGGVASETLPRKRSYWDSGI